MLVVCVGSWNATSGFNETVEINGTTISAFAVTQADSQNWTQPDRFRIDDTGLGKLAFLLSNDGDFVSAYRETLLGRARRRGNGPRPSTEKT